MPSALDHSGRTRIFNELFRDYHETPFAFRSADGWLWSSSPAEKPQCTMVLKTDAAWHALVEDPTERRLGEAFIDGELDVEGDIFSVFSVAHYIFERPVSLRTNLLRGLARSTSEMARFVRHGPRHSMARDRSSISYHYDLPIDFYRPWLGPTLAYSCAYFRDPAEDLDCAQKDKLELICRKLELGSNDRFLDIGCGWGSLLLHAAAEHGAKAYGITLSREQAAIASERIAQAKLVEKCTVELRDYRQMPKLSTRFDKIASVGMFEHVGLKNLREYFTIALRMLHPDGLFLNHGIARAAHSAPAKDSFIRQYVFPDGELVTLNQVVELAESVGFEVRDVDNLRTHYAQTLRLWVESLQKNAKMLLETVSERTYRIWLLYMAGSSDAFRRGDIELYQVLLGLPQNKVFQTLTTRENWYKNWLTASSRSAAS